MIDYAAARAVAEVVRTGSFDKAAATLNVTPSAVSQRIKHLEERLGAVLIVRGTPCLATDTGLWLCRHMEQVGLLEQALMAHLPMLSTAEAPLQRVTLTVAANADSLGTWFMQAVTEFARTTEYLLNVSVDDEEHTADWLRRGQVIAAVTALARPVQGCDSIPIGALRYHATASPEFMAKYFANGVTPEALAKAPALTFNQKDRLQTDWARRTFGRDIAFPTHWLPSTQSFLAGSLGGMGWALNPAPLAQEHLRSGALIELCPGEVLDRHLFWQINRLAAGQLHDLTKTIRAVAREHLYQP